MVVKVRKEMTPYEEARGVGSPYEAYTLVLSLLKRESHVWMAVSDPQERTCEMVRTVIRKLIEQVEAVKALTEVQIELTECEEVLHVERSKPDTIESIPDIPNIDLVKSDDDGVK